MPSSSASAYSPVIGLRSIDFQFAVKVRFPRDPEEITTFWGSCSPSSTLTLSSILHPSKIYPFFFGLTIDISPSLKQYFVGLGLSVEFESPQTASSTPKYLITYSLEISVNVKTFLVLSDTNSANIKSSFISYPCFCNSSTISSSGYNLKLAAFASYSSVRNSLSSYLSSYT